MAMVSGHLSHHVIVAGELGIPPAEIDDIEGRYCANTERREAVLRRWINKEGNAATYRALYDVLMRLHEKGSAEKILDISRGNRK